MQALLGAGRLNVKHFLTQCLVPLSFFWVIKWRFQRFSMVLKFYGSFEAEEGGWWDSPF